MSRVLEIYVSSILQTFFPRCGRSEKNRREETKTNIAFSCRISRIITIAVNFREEKFAAI